MGKGDKKTAKGKRFMGSFGNSRPASLPKKNTIATTSVVAKATPTKAKNKKIVEK